MYSQVKSWSQYHFLGGLCISLFLCEEAKKTVSTNKKAFWETCFSSSVLLASFSSQIVAPQILSASFTNLSL